MICIVGVSGLLSTSGCSGGVIRCVTILRGFLITAWKYIILRLLRSRFGLLSTRTASFVWFRTILRCRVTLIESIARSIVTVYLFGRSSSVEIGVRCIGRGRSRFWGSSRRWTVSAFF